MTGGWSIAGGTAAFWRFWDLRERARLHKASGAPPPHSDDPVVARWRFCNVYRDLDRGTQWFAARRGAGLEQVLWRSLTYRTVNRLETFEALEQRDGPRGGQLWQTPATYREWLEWLAARAEEGRPVFGGRHCTRGLPRLRETLPAAHVRLGELTSRLRTARGDLQFTCALLKELPHVGDFYAWQVARDLVEAGELSEDARWALAGAGARRGAARVLRAASASVSAGVALEVMRDLRDEQHAAAALGLDRSRWHRVPVTLADLEHGLCEFSRYETIRDARGHVRCEAYP